MAERVEAAGYRIANIDLTIVAQAPKMAPHIEAMRECLSGELQLEMGQVSVKATTTERLGFEGQQQGIAAHAVALLMLDGGVADVG